MKPIKLPIVNIDRKNRTAIVETKTGKKFPVTIEMSQDLIDNCIRRGDDAIIVKSAVTGEWLMTDYSFSNSFNYAVHNSMQTRYEDMICDERGVPYDF